MAQQGWIELPWRDSAKQPFDRIIDYMAQIPRLFSQLSNFSQLSTSGQQALVMRLGAEFRSSDAALQDIYREIKESVSGPLYWPTLSREFGLASNATKNPLFPVETAGTLMMFWATRALLWTAWNALQKEMGHDSHPEIEITSPLCDVSSLTANVCQSTEFCLHETHGVLGAYAVTTPLAICKASLAADGDHPQQVAWIRSTLEPLQNRGIAILKYQ